MTKQYFSVGLLYESVCLDQNDLRPGIWEESIRIVSANTQAQAQQRAIELAASGESTYQNQDGQTIAWKFRKISAVYELLDDAIGDGTEVFSRTLKVEETSSLLTPHSD